MSEEGRDGLAPLVLLVEDELGLSKLMVMILEEEGYRVAEAANGAQGLARLEQEKPALIITDYMMPELNGFEMVRTIRRNSSFDDVPILMMSGYTEQVAAPQFSNSSSGITGFLQKPFMAEDLIAVLRRFAEAQTD